MHSEIEKFWKDAGYVVNAFSLSTPKESPYTWFSWYASQSNEFCINHLIIACYKDEMLYYWDKIEYSEVEMLRIIKMKAFL